LSDASARLHVTGARIEGIAGQLVAAGLVSRDGQELLATQRGSVLFDRMVDAHRTVLHRLTASWSPEQHVEAKAMLDRLARNLIAEPPIAPAGALSAPPSR
jgi:DNA-binding MarR family transcriptional regulator